MNTVFNQLNLPLSCAPEWKI